MCHHDHVLSRKKRMPVFAVFTMLSKFINLSYVIRILKVAPLEVQESSSTPSFASPLVKALIHMYAYIHMQCHDLHVGAQEMAGKQWAIRIDEELNNMGEKSAESMKWSKRSIYRIPASVTDLNKRAYKPQIVSIGAYHHGMDNLKAMEEHKHRALLHFLKRSDKTIWSCIDALTPVVQDLKDAYDQLDPKWQDDDAFLEMMILDGCFILELVRTTTTPTEPPSPHPLAPVQAQTPQSQPESRSQTKTEIQAPSVNYASNDPIFGKHGKLYIVPYLKRDMLMLENQIPMLVLEKLAGIQKDNSLKKGKELIRRILKFFFISVSPRQLQQFGKCYHILDIYRKSLLLVEPHGRRTKPKSGQHSPHQGGDEVIRSATELHEAGITITKSKSRSLKDISFHRGVLKLPLVVVDDALESLFLNMIAFERFHVGAGNEVTAYAFFMDNIIDKARDVSLLHECGIIQNALGSDKAVANLFNTLSKDTTLDPDGSLDEVHKQVSAYCQKRWNRWRANLMHTYFTNPWAILSVVAACFLFALTIIQTVYSVLSAN